MEEFPATQMLEHTQLLEATQIISDQLDDSPIIVGRIEVGSEKFHIKLGDNRIGRDPKSEIYISNPSLSRNHAVIEAGRDGCFIHDVKSSNGTRKGGVKLKPIIRYHLVFHF